VYCRSHWRLLAIAQRSSAGFAGLGVLPRHAARPEALQGISAIEYNDFPGAFRLGTKTEWTRAVLRTPTLPASPTPTMRDGRQFPGYWTMDYPPAPNRIYWPVGAPADAHRYALRSEPVVDWDGTRRIYNWPGSTGVEVGHWKYGGIKPRSYANIYCAAGPDVDDFHGSTAADHAAQAKASISMSGRISIRQLEPGFSGRPSRTFRDRDPIFHHAVHLETASRCPALRFLRPGHFLRKSPTARCRTGAASATIRPLMVAICTIWIWATPGSGSTILISEKMASLAITASP